MALEEKQLVKGLKYIVGTWEIDYVVNILSNNLDHIPASEFKSQDGKDLSKVTFEFFQDHTMKLKNGVSGEEESGHWEQISDSKFHYDCKFFGVDNAELLKGIQTLEKDMQGGLVFNMFFVVRIKRTAKGALDLPKKVTIDQMQPTPDDLAQKDLVGRWKVYKSMACVGDNFGMFTRAEIEADYQKKKAAGEAEDDDLADRLGVFGTIIEFTDDYKMLTYSPIPAGVPKEEIDKAVESGEIKLVNGMMVADEPKDWKHVRGEYWVKCGDCGEENNEDDDDDDDDEEKTAPWMKISPDSEGHVEYTMFILEKEK